jgi:hypothetical protein
MHIATQRVLVEFIQEQRDRLNSRNPRADAVSQTQILVVAFPLGLASSDADAVGDPVLELFHEVFQHSKGSELTLKGLRRYDATRNY